VPVLGTAAGRTGHRSRAGAGVPTATWAGLMDGLPLRCFHAGGHMVFLTGDVAEADLMALASAIAAPLYRELSGV